MENKKERSVSRTFALWVKTLACLLSLLLVLYAVPTTVYAELIETLDLSSDDISEGTQEETDVGDDVQTVESEKAVFEVTDRREETVKHFRTEDGSFTAVQYSIPVHEKDENGEWQDIDNTLSESGSEYATPNARVKFAKKTTGNETLFTLHDGNRKITMSLSGANKKVAGQVTNTQTEFSEDATQLQKLMTLDKLSSKILYPEILDGVDLEYVVNSCNIKENIIVKERADTYSYTFEIELNNLEAVLCEDGSVALQDPDTDEVVYTIPKGYMFDANGAYSDAVAYTLTNGGNGKYSLTVTADAEWINNVERVFPVTVDPPINSTAAASGIVDTYIDSQNPSYAYSSFTYLASGTGGGGQEFISYWKINSLPTIPANAYLVSAQFSLYCQEYQDHFDRDLSVRIGAYQVTTDWSSSVTWTQHASNTVGAFSSATLIDYADVNADSESCYVSWDITRLYKMWNQGTTNYGIALARLQSGESDALYASSETSNDPRLIIHYRDMKGVESYRSGASHGAGLAGSGFVNHANGDLVFVMDTISTGDSLFGYMPNLVYHSSLGHQYYTQSYNANVPYARMSTGQGIKLSTNETIVEKTVTDENGDDATCFVWADGDGTEHYFLPDSSASTAGTTVYRDEDGLLLTLSVDNDSKGYSITDVSGNIRHFKKYTESTNIHTGGVLDYIQDAYGNRLLFALNDYGHTTAISVLPSGHETAVEYLTFTYNSLNILSEIRNSFTRQVVSFLYYLSYTDTGYIGSHYGGPLYQVKYGHLSGTTPVYDTTVTYTYTAVEGMMAGDVYRLATVTDETTDTSIRYGYDVSGRVWSVTEYGGDTKGQSISFTYGTEYAEVRNSGADDILQSDSNSDDIITHYSLDYQGRAVSSYSTNAARTAMYGAANQTYVNETDENTNANTKNSLKSAAVIDSVSINYIYNGGFDLDHADGLHGWTKSSENITVGYGTSFYDRELQIPVDSGGSANIYQDVVLPAGSYTLSTQCRSNKVGMELTLCVLDGTDPIATGTHSIANMVGVTNTLCPTLNFTLDADQTVRIRLTVTGADDNDGVLFINNVMLTNTVGASAYNMIQFGGFADTYTDNSNTAAPADTWNTQNAPGAAMPTSGGLFDSCLSITGNVVSEQYVTQRVNVTAAEAIQAMPSIISPVQLAGNRTFTVSGFAKANAQVANEDSPFALRVAVYYYGVSEPDIMDYQFNKELSDWQFTSGTFTTPSDQIVQYIDVSCVYANQPGMAYFDQISLVEERGGNAANYKYNEAGLVEYVYTPTVSTYYQYDELNNPSYTYDSLGNGCYYAYSGRTLLSETTFKFDPKASDLVDWYEETHRETNPVNSVWSPACTVISKTDYTINTYGLNTSTTAYAAQGTVEAATQRQNTPRMATSTSYYLTEGSCLFGRLYSSMDTSGVTTYYVYDSRGLLLYEYQMDYTGLYYLYDALGRQTGVLPLMYSLPLSTFTAVTGAETVSYTYDPQTNRLTQITTATTTYTFTYDAFGNTTSIKAGDSTLVTYTYNQNNGKLLQVLYGTGKTVNYTYDALDRVKEICYNDGTESEYSDFYSYTSDGALQSVESTGSGRRYDYLYNLKGQVMEMTEYEKDENGSYVPLVGHIYEYDDLDRLNLQQSIFEYTVGESTGQTDVTYHYEYADSPDANGVIDTDNVGELTEFSVSGADYHDSAAITYTYDELYRPATKTLEASGGITIGTTYTYRGNSARTTTLVSGYTSVVTTPSKILTTSYEYTYSSENITKIIDSNGNTTRYVYDDLDQLIREDNQALGKSYVYTYDNGGNRTSKTTYAYTTGTLGTDTATQTLTYSTSEWGDQLTGTTYDAIGNPLTYNGYDMTWDGRKLMEMSMTGGQFRYTFEYNADGIRTAKYSNGTWHYYTLEGSRIVTESWGSRMLVYLYDESGAPIGLQYRQNSYENYDFDTFYFEKNLFGDIVAIYNEDGDKIGSYTYDAWGNFTVSTESGITVTERNIVRTYNPFRYRGYYYDTDTGLYYLQSRYYNPQWGRFLNADGYVSTGSGLLGYNMYTYCLNNPITKIDYGGAKPGDLFDTPDDAAEDFGRYINEKSIAEGREYSSYVYSVRVSETRTITIINPNIFGKNIFSNIWNCLFNNSVTKTITVTITVTKYSYSKPMAGTIDNVIFPVILHHANVFRKKVALLHTHGNYVEKYRAGNDNFSDTDKWAAKIFGVPYYVATPAGTLRKYDPRTDTDVLLFSDLPFDPNHP